MVVMAGGRLRGRGFDSPIGTFFFTPFLSFFFYLIFPPFIFSFMLAPPFQCSSIFLVVLNLFMTFICIGTTAVNLDTEFVKDVFFGNSL